MDLYRKLRPNKLSQVVGQDNTVKALRELQKKGNIPHVIMLSGPSGVGKTTIGRIIARMLRCKKVDFQEINAANDKGIGTIREIETQTYLAPMAGDVKVWLLDEAHMLSSAAESCALKLLEDVPEHVYFILATTEPAKVARAIRTRCAEFKLKSLSRDVLAQLLGDRCPEVVKEAIVDASEGSARTALVLLQQVEGLESEQDMLDVVAQEDSREAIILARQLIGNASWDKIASTLKQLDSPPETVRYTVLAYCRSVLLGGGKKAPRAFEIVDAFREPFTDMGPAGLVSACWECK